MVMIMKHRSKTKNAASNNTLLAMGLALAIIGLQLYASMSSSNTNVGEVVNRLPQSDVMIIPKSSAAGSHSAVAYTDADNAGTVLTDHSCCIISSKGRDNREPWVDQMCTY